MAADERSAGTTHRWWVLAVVCMAMFMGVLDSTSVYAALPVIALDVGFAPAEVQWVLTAYRAAIDGLLIVVTLYAQQVLGLSALQFGMATAIMTVTSVVGVMAGQHLVTRAGFRAVATGGLILLMFACVVLSRLSVDGTVVGDLLAGLVVFGAGMGVAFVAGQIAALAGVADHDAGLAAGLAETAFAVGTTLGAGLASAIAIGFATRGTAGPPSAAELTGGLAAALYGLAALAAIGALGAAVLLRTPRTATERIATSS
ncbi:hypothetical protein [Brevibacterium jeotgali]|uniref:Major facilitator superfamily (MFS) profile domain-containing protein n=1 Tax=Brevibacterium jeotgali TaxID=1262550 RepID=A0A2H1L808_9MICO|nr:hypothetical protein [Brevibacterium jeotgali]TWC03364.1 hypothetical protein FB108_2089 [Brevibacterium jeotgali]SMY13026.1 hypothetical protein BJEO58_02634 [Brevibacterium jeotgali]